MKRIVWIDVELLFLEGFIMKSKTYLFVFLLSVFILTFAVACGDDDDDDYPLKLTNIASNTLHIYEPTNLLEWVTDGYLKRSFPPNNLA